MRAEKPAWYLAVISGALLRTLDFVAARSAEYLGYLEKGQLPPARLTLTAFEEAFVLEGAPAGPLALTHHWRSMKDGSMPYIPCRERTYAAQLDNPALSMMTRVREPAQTACVGVFLRCWLPAS